MEVLDLVAEIDRDRNQLRPRSAPSAPPAATKKSISSVAGPSAPSAVWTNMKPPAPNPVNGPLGDERGQHSADRGIHGISALSQHLRLGLGVTSGRLPLLPAALTRPD